MYYSIWPNNKRPGGAWICGTFIPTRQLRPSIKSARKEALYRMRGNRGSVEVLDDSGMQQEVFVFEQRGSNNR